jgi:hypothetical protein
VTPYNFEVAIDTAFVTRLNAGDPLLITASRAATWTTSDAAICAVDGGMVTGVSPGTCIVTATGVLDPSVFHTVAVTVVARPKTSYSENVYVKGAMPPFPLFWAGGYPDMMRLSADYTWQWTWTFNAASSDASPYHFKFVASRDSWPPPLIFSSTTATTLAGPLIDEQTANQGSLPDIRIAVEAATYLFTFHEDTVSYEIVKQ